MGAKLKEAGVGKRKTVFVCYSMGGLVTKKMLEIFPELGAKLEGVVFLGTPHFGSPVAKLFTHETEALGKITTYLKDYNIVTPDKAINNFLPISNNLFVNLFCIAVK